VDRLESATQHLTEAAEVSDLLAETLTAVKSLTRAERGRIFVRDGDKQTLTNAYGSDNCGVSIGLGRGLIGKCWSENVLVNVPDAYEDPGFDSSIDILTSEKTHQLVLIPLLNSRREVSGVLQLGNRSDASPFTDQDIAYAQLFAAFMGLIIENARVFAAASTSDLQMGNLSRVIVEASGGWDAKENVRKVVQAARDVVGADRCSVFVIDEVIGSLSTYYSDDDKMPSSIPMSHGLAATCARTKEPRLVNDAYHEPNFNKMIDFHTGHQTRMAMVAPMLATDGKVLGVVQVLNKQEGLFSSSDLKLMQTFATVAAAALEKRQLKDVCDRGAAEIDMGKWIGDHERSECSIPIQLQLSRDVQEMMMTRNYFSIEYAGIGLIKVAFWAFNLFDLLESFKIKNDLFFTFLYEVRSRYTAPPYHSFIHAIDVLQFFSFQIKTAQFDGVLTRMELLAVCTAAISHDLGHRGLNNVYNVNAETPLGILFKDTSVMETYHCTVIISIMDLPRCNIFYNLSTPELKKIWTWVIRMILATDMAHHFRLVKHANDTLDAGPINLGNPVPRLLAMTMLMKVSDVSNVARPFDIASKWSDVLCEEFWRQGDLEIAGGLAISSPQNERGKGNKAKGQIAFYTAICIPLYQAIARLFPELEVNTLAVEANLEQWKSLYEREMAEVEDEKKALAELQTTNEEIPSTEMAIVTPDDDDD
jgi:GAF domain-containing protein